MMVFHFRRLGVVLLSLSLFACGFHLRGNAGDLSWLNPLYLETAQLDQYQQSLIETSLKKSSVRLVENAPSANRLNVKLSALKTRRIASSQLSDIELLQLSMDIQYSVKNSAGILVHSSQRINLSKELELDANNVLAHEQAIANATRSLQQNLVRSMLARLSH